MKHLCLLGDCLDTVVHQKLFQMAELSPLEGFDALVTDPPYEIGFMGRSWDKSGVAVKASTWKVLSNLLKPGANCFVFAHPRIVHRVATALEDAGLALKDMLMWFFTTRMPKTKYDLKPAYEPILVARKPGSGRLFTERCLVPYKDEPDWQKTKAKATGRGELASSLVYGAGRSQHVVNPAGRRPANMMVDEETAEVLGSASRILHVPKVRGNRVHITQKPLDLMRQLVRLASPPMGKVLDPFAGSGTTLVAAHLEGMLGAGIEKDPDSYETMQKRLMLRSESTTES